MFIVLVMMCVLSKLFVFVLKIADAIKPPRKKDFIYFTNGRYIECLSLTYATDKSKA